MPAPELSGSLTVIVIGRNEERVLEKTFASLRSLPQEGLALETIYVDSASTDESVSIATRHADRVLILPDSDRLCAAWARDTGANEASGEWLLHLDGDMTLCPEFVREIYRHITASQAPAGLIGDYVDVYRDGSRRRYTVGRQYRFGSAAVFGGAVLLPARAVREAGGWDPAIHSNEELDLCYRLRARGCNVHHVPCPFVEHHTDRLTRLETLKTIFFPSTKQPQRFFGFGQLLHAAVKNRRLFSLLQFMPQLFIFWLSIGLGVCLLATGSQLGATLSLAVGIGAVVLAKGPKYVVIYCGLLVQTIAGYRRYRPAPQVSGIQRIMGQSDDA